MCTAFPKKPNIKISRIKKPDRLQKKKKLRIIIKGVNSFWVNSYYSQPDIHESTTDMFYCHGDQPDISALSLFSR